MRVELELVTNRLIKISRNMSSVDEAIRSADLGFGLFESARVVVVSGLTVDSDTFKVVISIISVTGMVTVVVSTVVLVVVVVVVVVVEVEVVVLTIKLKLLNIQTKKSSFEF